MGDAIKVTVIATGFDAIDNEIPVELAAPARALASPPTRRETMRDSLREGFSNAPALDVKLSGVRPKRQMGRSRARRVKGQPGLRIPSGPALRDVSQRSSCGALRAQRRRENLAGLKVPHVHGARIGGDCGDVGGLFLH